MIWFVSIAFGLGTSSFFGASGAGATSRLGTAPAGRFGRTAPSATITAPKPSARAKGAVQSVGRLAYDLVEANGKVSALGGAAYYGSAFGRDLVAPIISLVSTPDRKGYWLIGADGGVYPFGNAKNEGGAGGRLRPDPVVAAAATPGGGGYWLVTSAGEVMAFGDAKNHGSVTSKIRGHVVGIVATADGRGYWITCSTGAVFNFGDAQPYGAVNAYTPGLRIVAMAATPDGGGYWLADADGRVFSFGDAAPLAPSSPVEVTSPVVGIAVTPGGTGAWMAEQNGTVLSLGDATAHGSLAGAPAASPVASIAAMAVDPAGPLRYPRGAFGYDINWPQCTEPGSSRTVALPGPPSYAAKTAGYTVAVVGVDGWAVGAPNPCLRAEVKWAAKAQGTGGAPPYDLYMFLNSPSSSDTIDQQGPAGICAEFSGTAQAKCLAYNYGYNSAQLAMQHARSQGASSPVWWLDVENDLCGRGQYWSCNHVLNSLTIQGSLDFLQSESLTVGIYSTSVQWQGITGGYVPSGPQVPIWVAGAYWTSPPYPSSYGYWPPSALAPYCGAKYAFAGGKAWLLQETPGPNDYPFDPDYAC